MSDPTPDAHGRYRVAEVIDGKTRHYSTARYIPGKHTIVTGPDAAASDDNGNERPPKHNVAGRAHTPAPTDSPKGATA